MAAAPLQFIKCVDVILICGMLRRTNEQQHIRGDTQKDQKQGDTQSQSQGR